MNKCEVQELFIAKKVHFDACIVLCSTEHACFAAILCFAAQKMTTISLVRDKKQGWVEQLKVASFFPEETSGTWDRLTSKLALTSLTSKLAINQTNPPAKKNKGPASWSVPSFLKLLWNRVGILWCTSCSSLISCSLISFFFPMFCVFFVWDFFAFFQLCLFSTLLCVLLQHVCFFSTRASSARALLQRDASSAWGGMPTKLDMPMQCDLVKAQTNIFRYKYLTTSR